MHYTREDLIKICEKAFVSQNKWSDRDSASSQIKLGSCYALLKAGCKFEIKTKENSNEDTGCITDERTIWIQFWVHDFMWFENGEDEDGNKDGTENSDYHFYLPTIKRLEKVKRNDWY